MVRIIACCTLIFGASFTATAQNCSTSISNNVGDTVTVTATLFSTDPNENGEGEPLFITTTGGEFSTTVSSYAIPQTFTYTATGVNEGITGVNLGADGDESCTVTAASNQPHFLSPGQKSFFSTTALALAVPSGGFWTLAELCAPGTVIPGVNVPATLCAVPSGLLAAGFATAAALSGLISADPPDPNYMQVAVPIIPSIPAVPASNGTTPAMAAAYNALLVDLAQIVATERALYISLNRASGATAARDTYWVSQQQMAITRYQNQLSGYFAKAAAAMTAFQNALRTTNLNYTLSATSVEAFESLVASSGLPTSDLYALNQFLDSPTEITSATQIAIVQNINTASGPVSSALTPLITSLQGLSASVGGACTVVNQVKAAFGSTTGQPGFIVNADLNKDGAINVVDLATAARALPAGSTCP